MRQLKQLVSSINCRHVGPGLITIGDIPIGDIPKEELYFTKFDLKDWRENTFEQAINSALAKGAKLDDIVNVAKDTAVQIVVSNENGNLQQAAEKLGVSDRTLQKRRKEKLGVFNCQFKASSLIHTDSRV